MGTFRTSLWIAWLNFCRWKKDLRVILIFLFTGLLIGKDLQGFVKYGLDMGQQCTVCMLPVLFLSFSISVGTIKMVIFIGLLLLLCDVPFVTGLTPYVLYRSGRRSWWGGGCLYILAVTFLYAVFITLASVFAVLPVASFDPWSWGGVLEDMVWGNGVMTADEIYESYWHVALPEQAIQNLTPYAAQAYTFLSVWGCFIFLGLLMYLAGQFTQNVVWILMAPGSLVFLDPILNCFSFGKRSWLLALSPVSWVSPEVLNLVNSSQFLSVPFVTCALLLLILVSLLGGKAACMKQKDLKWLGRRINL